MRRNSLVRDLVAETVLDPRRWIQPYFVDASLEGRAEVPSMPGIFRESVTSLIATVTEDLELGINRIMLFGVGNRKSADAGAAFAADNPVACAIEALRKEFGERLFISADVCLCAYTDSGHCGLMIGDSVDNDSSLPILAKMALRLANAGVDWVAPSDMMDGRVAAIRHALDNAQHTDVGILAYTAKFASSYYGPFREAADSSPSSGDRKSYQMDFRNRREAYREAALDIEEGADVIMVKPALAYLDIIADLSDLVDTPLAAYNVSGEYAMVKLAVREGLANERDLVLENLTAITRAGASIILTYHLRDILRNEWLK